MAHYRNKDVHNKAVGHNLHCWYYAATARTDNAIDQSGK